MNQPPFSNRPFFSEIFPTSQETKRVPITTSVVPLENQTIKITFNKNTHVRRWDRENETEHEAILFIEPKGEEV